jgi:hypothetical protein
LNRKFEYTFLCLIAILFLIILSSFSALFFFANEVEVDWTNSTPLAIVPPVRGSKGSVIKTWTPSNYQTIPLSSLLDYPHAFFTYSPPFPKDGDIVTFDASDSSDFDGTISRYDWDFGDGNTGTGALVTHSYSTGRYTITLTVTDNDGNTDIAIKSLEIFEKGDSSPTPTPFQTSSPTPTPSPTPSENGDFSPSQLSDNMALWIGAPVAAIGIALTIAAAALWRRKRKGSKSEVSPVLAAKSVPATINVLFLAANPDGTTPLDLNTELNAIEDVLDSCKFRDRFNLEQRFELKPGDIAKMLLKYDPHIVHFSGHGSEAGEIILQDANGESRPVDASAISNLFSVLKGNIRCVVLNACYSKVQAKLISKYIDCVIGMSKAIGDEAAIQFAEGFYRGLGFGKDLETAFKLGCAEIDLEGLDEEDTPKIIWKNDQPQKILFT